MVLNIWVAAMILQQPFLLQLMFPGQYHQKSCRIFFSIINRFFKYGIEKHDVIQFDAEVKPEILTLKKAKKKVQITGRGGTNFQAVIDFYESNPAYDGLILFTDGEAPCPKIHRTLKKLWFFPKF